MGNDKVPSRLQQVKNEAFRQARIAAVNKFKQSIVYQWQRKKQPAMFFFAANNIDRGIATEAVDELMEQYPGTYFLPTFEDDA